MSLNNLYYAGEEGWERLPDWARFFLSLGAFIAAQPKSETRWIVGVAIPTRAYAAALAAAGVIYGQTTTKKDGGVSTHFQRLCNMARGAAVTYLHGRRNLEGILLGYTDQFGERRLIVQTRNPRAGGDTHYVAERDALRVQIPAEADQYVAPQDLPDRQTGRLVAPVCSFARRFLGEENVNDFAMRSRLDCLVVGRLSSLRQEITETNFRSYLSTDSFLDSTDEALEGTLLDILRVRKFMSEGKAYRTDAVAANSQNVPIVVRNSAPSVVIFDGSAGFVKWRGCWRSSHWVAILDATEPSFDEAARALNAEYVNRLDDEEPDVDVPPTPPAGIEIVFYRERSE